jgi:transcription antitermination factor NusG
VLGFVKFANELATVSEAEIELLRRITGVQSEVEIVPMEYEVGEEVEIASGNLAGMVGILVVVKQKNKVLIELKSINLGLLLEVDINNLLKTKYISAR